MSSIDWPSVDTNGVSLPTIVSSSDLFDGELFGDELIDIYNSAMVDEDHDDVHNEIPHLLPPSSIHDSKAVENDEAVQIAAAAAAIDDGLGAFRPSTSFSDLTNLLHPTSDAMMNAELPPITSDTLVPAVEDKSTKKRSSTAVSGNVASPPTPKRKAVAPKASVRRVSTTPKKQTAAGGNPVKAKASSALKQAQASAAGKPGTPDPLDIIMPDVVPATNSPPAMPKPVIQSVPHTAKPVADKVVSCPAPVKVKSEDLGNDNTMCSSNSEADFQTIAQAAVTSLMNNAGAADKSNMSSKMPVPDLPCSFDEKVDISTDHIKALTGNNWVNACNNVSAGASTSSQSSETKGGNRSRRQNLTPDERAKQNRDRNREHARNTRLRKKAYVEELKKTLTELVAQRDASELEKRHSAQRELEQREVRFRVIEEFLKLRGRNETNFARWAAILEDGFTLNLPLSDYRKSGKASLGDHVLRGVPDVMAESSSFADFLQTLAPAKAKGTISFQYSCDRSNFFMDGCNAFLEWTATSVGAVSSGAFSEMTLRGVLRGKFCPASNKLVFASMSFDTGRIQSKMGGSTTQGVNVNSAADIAAAQAADAILDSLEMPRLAVPVMVPSAVNVVHSSCSSTDECSDKGELDSDDSVSGDIKSSMIGGITTTSTVSCSD